MRALIILLTLAVAACGALAADAWRAVQQPLQIADAPQRFMLERGQSWHGVVRHMQRQGWLEHERDALYLRLYGRIDERPDRIRSGEYEIEHGMSVTQLLDRLVAGDVVQHDITFIEGWQLADALAALRDHEAVEQALPADRERADAKLREALDIDAPSAEGWFLPETYRFTRGTSDLAILERAHRALRQALEAAWDERDEDLPLSSPEELLILASIVEKETGKASERGRVAGVFKRRLELGMRLQTDPTVLYGRDPERSGRLRRIDLVTDTPYNTYTRHGLPPTPICLPGTASLRAAAQPEEGTALYFVSRNDGTHVFSDTLEAHNRAVNRYQRGGGQ